MGFIFPATEPPALPKLPNLRGKEKNIVPIPPGDSQVNLLQEQRPSHVPSFLQPCRELEGLLQVKAPGFVAEVGS